MKLYLLFILILLANSINAQTKIFGKVTDKNGTPLPGANIYIKDTYDGISTDANGEYSFITSETEEAILVASFIGYKIDERKIIISGKEIEIDIILEEEATEMNTVVISAGSFEASDEKKSVILRPLDIVTTAGADADIYGALATLPGTQIKGETEGLFVRGGSAVETKTIIDEMVVQNPYYSSVPDVPSRGRFSPFLFKGTIFSTGGYSAQYGQALSSALILKSMDLAPVTTSAINLMAVGFGGAHTQRWVNTSLSITADYYDLNPYFKIQKQRTDWETPPIGIDNSLVFRHKTSSTGIVKLYSTFSSSKVSLYQENLDNISSKDFFQLNSKNFYLNTSYRDILGEDWSFFAGISYSKDLDDIKINNDIIDANEELSQGKLTIIKSLFDGSFITFGGEIHNRKFDDSFNDLKAKATDVYSAAFAEADIFFTNNFAARLGLRFENSSLLNKTNLAPRTSFAYKIGAFSQINLAYGQFFQTPEREFLRYDNNLAFEQADHYILNYQYLDEEITFRIEGYYKNYDELIKQRTFPVVPSDPIDYDNSGKGYAKGIDIFWRDKTTFDLVDYWISYTYLDTKRDYKDFETLAAPTFATPHTLSIVYKQWFPDITTSLGVTYTFATGRPYYNPNSEVYLGDKTKSYNNLSMNISYLTNIFNNFTVVYFSMGNILGINNVFGYRYSSNGQIRSAIVPPALKTVFIGLFISIEYNRN